jgi:hypothetical protein
MHEEIFVDIQTPTHDYTQRITHYCRRLSVVSRKMQPSIAPVNIGTKKESFCRRRCAQSSSSEKTSSPRLRRAMRSFFFLRISLDVSFFFFYKKVSKMSTLSTGQETHLSFGHLVAHCVLF